MFGLKISRTASAVNHSPVRRSSSVGRQWRRTAQRLFVSGLFLSGCVLPIGTATIVCAEEGQSTNELLAALQGDDLQARREAAWDLGRYGEAALPAVDALAAAVGDRDQQVSNGAMQSLGQIGSAATAAIPALTKRLDDNDPQRRYRAAYALGHIAPADHPVYREGLDSLSSRKRAATLQAICWLGERSVVLSDDLIKLLPDTDEDVRRELIIAFTKQGEAAVIPLAQVLIAGTSFSSAGAEQQAANDRSMEVAAVILGELGPTANAACDALLQSVDASNTRVQAASLVALARIGCTDPQVTTKALAALRSDNTQLKSAAISALVQMRQRPADAVEQLITLLNDEPEIAQLATFALGRFGDAVQPALPQLVAQMNDQNAAAIMTTISQLGPDVIGPLLQTVSPEGLTTEKAAEIIANMGFRAEPTLRAMLAHGNSTERSVACLGLARLGVGLEEVVPLVSVEDAAVRAAAIRSLTDFGAAAQPHAGLLARHIADDSADVRAAALGTLKSIGVSLVEWTQPISQALSDSAPHVRAQAADCLGTIESPSDVTVTALGTAMADSDAKVRRAAANALGQLGPKAIAATPALINGTQDSDADVVRAAAVALAATQPTNPEVIRAITGLLDHNSLDIRLSAITALGNAGEGASAARPRLEELARAESSEIRLASIVALNASLPVDERLTMLTGHLSDNDWTVRNRVLELIGDMKDKARAAVPQLLTMIKNNQDAETANLVLRRIDSAPPEAVPILLELLQDRRTDRRQQFYALYLIRKVTPPAKDALPVLREMQANAEGRVAEYVERAIKAIEEGE
ncbi:MAG: HEAT repeat domain-containing protein [Planctomycetales bacterium]|nr:HEAT repeat domain-containing protein [Planctomycetales bacterium]